MQRSRSPIPEALQGIQYLCSPPELLEPFRCCSDDLQFHRCINIPRPIKADFEKSQALLIFSVVGQHSDDPDRLLEIAICETNHVCSSWQCFEGQLIGRHEQDACRRIEGYRTCTHVMVHCYCNRGKGLMNANRESIQA